MFIGTKKEDRRESARHAKKPTKKPSRGPGRRSKMRDEIAFFDVETTAPSSERRWWLLEFGAILVCPRKLVEVGSYDTLIRPGDLSAVSKRFLAGDDEAIRSAPAFEEVADEIFDILDGRVWAGHNIQRFDCPRIREAFADIGRPAPEPVGVIDSLNLLTHAFGRRAGDLKMATLASYFGIGKQKHRSLDDARMNLEVLKHCATVLLLESSLPDVLCSNAYAGGAVTRTRRRAQDDMISSWSTPNSNKLLQTSTPFTPPAPAAPAPSRRRAPPAAPAAAATQKINNGSCKRDNLGKVVEKAKGALSGSRRATTTTTPFHMILRHSRAIVR